MLIAAKAVLIHMHVPLPYDALMASVAQGDPRNKLAAHRNWY